MRGVLYTTGIFVLGGTIVSCKARPLRSEVKDTPPINAAGEAPIVASEMEDLIKLGFQKDVAERILKYQHNVYSESLAQEEAGRRPAISYRGVSLPPCNDEGCYSPTYRSGDFSAGRNAIYTAANICYAMNYARSSGDAAGTILELQIPAFLTQLNAGNAGDRAGKPATGYSAPYNVNEECAGLSDTTEIMVPFKSDVFNDDRPYLRRIGLIPPLGLDCEGNQVPRQEIARTRKSPKRICWLSYGEAYDAAGKWVGP